MIETNMSNADKLELRYFPPPPDITNTIAKNADNVGDLPPEQPMSANSDVPTESPSHTLRVLFVGDPSQESFLSLRENAPQISIETISHDQLHGAIDAGFACVAVVPHQTFDDVALNDLHEVAAFIPHIPVVALFRELEGGRTTIRNQLRKHGIVDYLTSTDLSPVLLEFVLEHALEHARFREDLNELRDRFALAMRGAHDGMWEWDLSNGRVFYSERWKELLQYPFSSSPDTIEFWYDQVHPYDLHRLQANIIATIEGRIVHHECEHRVYTSDGRIRWVVSRAMVQRDGTGVPLRISGSLTDITDFRQREQHLREQFRHDALTKLPRRDVFFERLARAIELNEQFPECGFSVLLITVDRMTMLRDSLGLEVANAAFAHLASIVRDCVRIDDLVCRFGSDKFAVLIEGDDALEQSRTLLANRLRETLQDPFEIIGHRLCMTVSIGMTSSARNYSRVDDIIADAGAAVNHARMRGPDQHETFHVGMRTQATSLLRLEMALREALDNNQFHLCYQPIMCLQSKTLLGFESLLRWDHPHLGRVSPADFIPIAENTGLIIPIGRWAMRQAATQLQQWHQQFELGKNLSVSVNLSGKQTSDPLLIGEIEAILRDTGLNPRSLKIELTETVLMENAEAFARLVDRVRGQGVQIYIDDFGTGYSSLGYLHRFPVDGLKIDKSFVDKLDGSDASATLVRTILNLAQSLEVDVIAEGIEDSVQAQHLHDLGCQGAQGYYFGKPLITSDASQLLVLPPSKSSDSNEL